MASTLEVKPRFGKRKGSLPPAETVEETGSAERGVRNEPVSPEPPAPTTNGTIDQQGRHHRPAAGTGEASGTGRLPHPATTGNSTPAGIVSNDPEAEGTTTEDGGEAGSEDGTGGASGTRSAERGARNGRRTRKQRLDDAVERPLAPGPAAGGTLSLTTRVQQLTVGDLRPHPANRRPKPADVERMADSLRERGQLEPILVREADALGLSFELVSGETRWLAAKRLGWKTIAARVVQCDPAAALELLAAANAERTDLDPIERAKLIQKLCAAKADGGAGMTREQAAKVVRLESASAASNLVRLLELPPRWQDRVAAGELPQSFARELLAIAKAPRLLDQAEKSWQTKEKSLLKPEGKRRYEDVEAIESWESRDAVADLVREIIEEHTRPLEGSYHYDSQEVTAALGGKRRANCYQYAGNQKLPVKITPAMEADLDVEEVSIDGKTARVATNVKAFDRIQVPAIVAKVDAAGKRRAEKAGQAKRVKRELSAAEKREEAKRAREKFAQNLAQWKTTLLKQALIEAIDAGRDTGYRVVLAGAAQGCPLDDCLADVAQVKSQGYYNCWPLVAGITSPANEKSVTRELAKRLLALDASLPDCYDELAAAFVADYAQALTIDLDAAWRRTVEDSRRRTTLEGKTVGTAPNRLEQFLLLHQVGPLAHQLAEWKVKCDSAGSREKMAAAVLAHVAGGGKLALPKCLKPARGKG